MAYGEAQGDGLTRQGVGRHIWGERQDYTDGAFSESIGCGLDLSAYGLGARTHRYALVVDRGTVTYAGLEADAGALTVSSAEAVLAALGAQQG
ncbi:hypothetical protein PMAC_000742 [Pneumocystis sp. 'macacae']|nr:hypothetical protein PMAC_000742 [Pneumocystis sp. 'macacae']